MSPSSPGRARALPALLTLALAIAAAAAETAPPPFLGVDPSELAPDERRLLLGADPEPPSSRPSPATEGLRIMINIPSRRLRIYRDARLELDVPMAIGRRIYPGETGNTRTRVGSYRITSWHRDYHNRSYPVPWSRNPWRGAFGKFTAKLGPDAAYQYIHGTVGPDWLDSWLVEKLPPPPGREVEDRPVLPGEFGLSHGCVRVSNRVIEEIRRMCPVGTPVEKFYCLTERVPGPGGGHRDVTLPNVYQYRVAEARGVFYPETGELEDYRGPPDAVGPR